MNSDGRRRLLACCVLAAALLGLFVHYGAVADEPGHDRLRTSTAALESPERHAGEPVYLWADVSELTEDRVLVTVGDTEIALYGVTTPLEPGDSVQVAGRLERKGSVQTERVVVSSSDSLQYLYAVSALGALFAAAFGLMHWRVDRRRLLIEPRDPASDTDDHA